MSEKGPRGCAPHVKPVRLRSFDLNLLLVFDAILKERSVVAASERLGLSPTAVSHALARLRRQLGNQLFVREARGMRPTARALELMPAVQRALSDLERAFETREFDPRHSPRTFYIGASDYSCTLLIPRLIERLARSAPAVDVAVVPANRVDMIRQLDEGRVELVIAWFAAVPERFGRTKLVEESFVLAVRKGHPLSRGRLTPARVLQFGHVIVDYVGNADNLVDGFLPEHGVMRRVQMDRGVLEAPQRLGASARIAARVPSFCNIPPVLERSDLVASVPRRLIGELSSPYEIVVLEPPFDTAAVVVEAIWHRRTEADPGAIWLRRHIESIARALR